MTKKGVAMTDPNQDDEQKRFRVIEVKPEELGGQNGNQSAWNLNDRWPGSAAPTTSVRKADGSSKRLSSIVVTTTTVVRFVEEDEELQHSRSGASAWKAADTWPGSYAPAGNRRPAESAWVANDRWPGSAAPTDDGNADSTAPTKDVSHTPEDKK
jgi:hypothetical protein